MSALVCIDLPAQPLPGTSIIDGFHTIVTHGGYIVPLAVQKTSFAFFLSETDADSHACSVLDVVALPPTTRAGYRFMQCHLGDTSHGFAVRSSEGATVAYWSVQEGVLTFRREPIHVIGEQGLSCWEPETGE